ncbi:uncharacterized protein LOC108045026 [Drosophila rhopaloa]|uniref:Uncharacterized protein LOC108045026 n=1 Tax=Drosophila rhopaloa TaxID=1041015 RepID=A0A6P4F2W4_DRORH|nr:uncharacterized protein LOC108045026 [Drosophila rhopaloa]
MESTIQVFGLLFLLGFAAESSPFPSPNATAVHQLFQRMDSNADTCNYFQQFSSGSYSYNDNCRAIQNSMSNTFNGKLRTMLKQLRKQAYHRRTSVEKKVLWFYDSCLTAPEETFAWEHYLEVLPHGPRLNWPPAYRKTGNQTFQWQRTLARLRLVGLRNLLFDVDVALDPTDSSRTIVLFRKPIIKEIQNNKENANLLKSLGVRNDTVLFLGNKISQLQKAIQKLAAKRGTMENLSIKTLKNRTKLPLTQYLKIVFGRSMESNSTVWVEDIEYLEGLRAVIDKYDGAVLINYLMVSYIRYLVGLNDSLPGRKRGKCIAAVRVLMQPASELLYNKYYPRNKEEVQRLFDDLKLSFLNLLTRNRLNLTDEDLSHHVRQQLYMTVSVGTLPDIDDQSGLVTNLYKNLKIDRGSDFAIAHLKVLQHRNRRVLAQLHKPALKENRLFNLSPEPYYEISENNIVVPFDTLQKSYFSPNIHEAFRKSLLGFVIARQMLVNFAPQIQPISLINQSDVPGISCVNRNCSSGFTDDEKDVLALALIMESLFEKDSELRQKHPSYLRLSSREEFLVNFVEIFIAPNWRRGRGWMGMSGSIKPLR